jgi:quercetin dioxygenase-like cupin family protein
MKSKAELFGAALGKAVRKTVDKLNEPKAPAQLHRTNLADAPQVAGLKRSDGWVDTQVQLLIDRKGTGAGHVLGRTVLKPGARHASHRHVDCDAFFVVLKGQGNILTENGEKPAVEGDVVYAPRGCWHGFANTSDQEVVLLWGLMGAGSIADSGYEVGP